MTSYREIFPAKGLIVSCQALPHEPLHGGDTMAKMARAAVGVGAIGIRTNGVADILMIKQEVNVPVIGLIKRDIEGSEIFITPTLDEVKAIVMAGADIVALDITNREGRLAAVKPLIAWAHEMGAAVMADISTFEEGVAAEALGVDYIGTTLSGYTSYSRQAEEPDFELIRQLAETVKVPVVAEGRIWTPEDAVKAMNCGATYVVVGSAISRPQLITERYIQALNKLEG
ncbi:putative N-acetylmannosamine-6-phosphate 2-epimerase [Paenibacillus marchantiophytorum]|uniref:Putative N-acetylmannosamine-6-phosphate 2-epimerase n=1 Tax=Paenibacillus marchantiophytorum TaxID=1619310 RepID=A0ABQ2BND3_9BACL|nr:N-acetylmannosamine-6-phosphate 2-epimerase [Paenibacillus marchantiophytorum]GGI43790.1 putative N-acetylmannosamine-6-phosphate 2-epimerase [Paenibacillus marchantiophytorum]